FGWGSTVIVSPSSDIRCSVQGRLRDACLFFLLIDFLYYEALYGNPSESELETPRPACVAGVQPVLRHGGRCAGGCASTSAKRSLGSAVAVAHSVGRGRSLGRLGRRWCRGRSASGSFGGGCGAHRDRRAGIGGGHGVCARARF